LADPTAFNKPAPPPPLRGHVEVFSEGPAGTVSGHVYDVSDGEPLVGAPVYVEGTELGNATDPRGEYVIARVPPGAHRLTAAYIGYRYLSANVVLESTSGVRADFWLGATIIELGHPVE
jgi:hypothetical protein